jgi:glycine cleavage system H protein
MATYYSEDHEWITVEGETATVGITEHAAEQLGEIVFVDQKEPGDTFEQGGEFGVIESVKAASDIICPLNCEVIEANEMLSDKPEALNESPESDAWIYKVKILDASQLESLMDLDGYKEHIS